MDVKNVSAVTGVVAGISALLLLRWWAARTPRETRVGAERPPVEILQEVLDQSVPVAAARQLAMVNGNAMTVECLLDGRQLMITCDPRAAAHIFRGAGCNKYRLRPAAEDGLRMLGMHHAGLIWNNDLRGWACVRRCFRLALSGEALALAAEVARRECGDLLDAALEAPGASDCPVLDLLDLARRVTFRTALLVFFGINSADFEHLGVAEGATIAAIVRYFKAWEYLFLRPARHWDAVLLERHRASVVELQACVRTLLAAAPAARQHSPPFLVELRAACGGDRGRLAEQAALEMLLAGTDTSSVTAYYALLGVAGDARLQEALCQELSQAAPGAGYAPLLEAVIDETLRFKPVGPVVLREAECADVDFPGAGPGGVRAGAAVLVHLAAMNLRPELWGADADAFRPHRFLPGAINREAKTARFWPFGDGPKGCVGMHLGRREVRAILEAAVRCYNLEVEGAETLGSLQTHWDIANQPDKPALIRVHRRL